MFNLKELKKEATINNRYEKRFPPLLVFTPTAQLAY